MSLSSSSKNNNNNVVIPDECSPEYANVLQSQSEYVFRCVSKFRGVLPVDKFSDLCSLIHNVVSSKIRLTEFATKFHLLVLPYMKPNISKELLESVKHDNPTLFDKLHLFETTDITTKEKMLKQDHSFSTAITSLLSNSSKKRNRNHDEMMAREVRRRMNDGTVSFIKNPVIEAEDTNSETNSDIKLDKPIEAEAIQKLSSHQIKSLLKTFIYNVEVLQNELEKKLREEEERRIDELGAQGVLCNICLNAKKNIIYYPCMHVTQCNNCPIQNACPLCRSNVQFHGKVFI